MNDNNIVEIIRIQHQQMDISNKLKISLMAIPKHDYKNSSNGGIKKS